MPPSARLYVAPNPFDATIRILNIRERFAQGMELSPGRYQVEVARSDYETRLGSGVGRGLPVRAGNWRWSFDFELRSERSATPAERG